MLCRVGYLMAPSGGVRPALDLNFLTGTLPSVVTFSRASAATDSFYTDAAGSSFNSYLSGVARLLATGFLNEETRTQSLLNSAAPVTQTTASLATGTYVFWCIGTGSVTSSAGTATASGLGAITGSQGTFQTIVVTVAGTLTFTVSGSINRFQLELGTYPTSFISSAAAPATRAVDAATVATSLFGLPANPTGATIIGRATVGNDLTSINPHYIASIDDGTTSNAMVFYVQPGPQMRGRVTTGGSSVTLGMVAPTANLLVRFWAAYAANDFAGAYNSNPKVVSAGPLALPTGLSVLRVGAAAFPNNNWNSTIAKLQIYTRRLPDTQAAALAAAL